MTDDDLKPLHKFEEFHQMVQLCKERRISKENRTSRCEIYRQ